MQRYHKIDPNLFIDNRKKLAQHLKPNSVAVLNANDIAPVGADDVFPFRQNSDLFYLSGIDQAETILVLYPDAPNASWRAMLFLRETSERTMIWEGHQCTPAEAQDLTGIAHIHALGEFKTIFHRLMGQATYIYLNTNEYDRATNTVQTRDDRFIAWCKHHYPLHQYERLAPIMQQLRAIKSAIEIDLIREACAITEKGFRKILPLIKPGIMEYALEAELIAEFIRNRAQGFAYEPIIASGANACVLHYHSNSQPCKAEQVILVDVGATYAHYCADLTRAMPVSGRFTQRQRAVYNAVLSVMQQAKQLLVPGNDLTTYHQAVGKVMEEELVGLGLLDRKDICGQDPNKPAYKKYFMHGTSHHLGLNTHDVGNVYSKFVPGMVLTIEPGIYIREEGLGIRLENNVVIREDGLEDLTATMPIAAEEIEDLMHMG